MTGTKKKFDTRDIKEQYDMLDDVTKAYAASILQAMTSTLQAIYCISALKHTDERGEENAPEA